MSKTKVIKIDEQLKKNLMESEQLFKIVFESSPVAIVVVDSRERIVFWNPLAEKILGMARKDLLNKHVSILYSPKEWQRLCSLNKRYRGKFSNIMTKIFRKDGTIIDVALSGDILRDNEGKVIGSVGMIQGIADNERAREMVMQAKLVAEEANTAKSVFLAQASHEIRTPLNAIIGMINLTLDTSLTEEQRDDLQVAKDAADNLLSLINDILDISRAQAGKVVIEKVGINVPDIIKNVSKGLMILARNKGVDVIWSIDPAIPRLLIGDPVRIRQVLVNLVNNAIKFTNKGKVEVNAKMKALADKNCEVIFEVTDSGIGISPKNLPHIFDIFTNVHNTTARRYGGTGLGLAICKKVVGMMGGSIQVESKEGVGSTFRFNVIFGFKPDALSNLSNGQHPPLGKVVIPTVPDQLKNLRILLAEDNIVNQRIVSRILEKVGWDVTAVHNGQEVLNILNNQTFDVILMDDRMPLLNGIEASQVIRREEKQTGHHVPIIAMTANALAGDKEKYLASGMDGYISKPIDRNLLVQEIIDLVSHRLNNE